MPHVKLHAEQIDPKAFQLALDARDVIGRWDWDAATDRVRADAVVALLFNVDPLEAADGAPLAAYQAAIHAEDRERVLALIRHSARTSSTYLTEYRVISVDDCTRWVLARGRFTSDTAGQPREGSGILVDITPMRLSEDAIVQIEEYLGDPLLAQAADHAMVAHKAIVKLQDAELKARADALLMALGRRLAQQELRERLRQMN